MVMINRATKEITFKIVYYGPGLCGKTTNLEYIYASANPKQKGKLLTVATETDRTLFFDFMPLELGTIRGMKVRVQLYTVPGQVFYDATRRIVLRGSDGVVFVADSQRIMMEANTESLENLKANLRLNSLDPESIPLVLQFNKQDLPDLAEADELDAALNWREVPTFLSVATVGRGVNETLKKIIEMVIRRLQSQDAKFSGREEEAPPQQAAPSAPPLPAHPQMPFAMPAAATAEEVPEAPTAPEVVSAPFPPAVAREPLPEVELEEGPAMHAPAGEPDMEEVEIETLQHMEPLPRPAIASPPIEEVEPEEPSLDGEVEGPEEEPVAEVPEAEPVVGTIEPPIPEPMEEGADAAKVRHALGQIRVVADSLMERVKGLGDEVDALRSKLDELERDLG